MTIFALGFATFVCGIYYANKAFRSADKLTPGQGAVMLLLGAAGMLVGVVLVVI